MASLGAGWQQDLVLIILYLNTAVVLNYTQPEVILCITFAAPQACRILDKSEKKHLIAVTFVLIFYKNCELRALVNHLTTYYKAYSRQNVEFVIAMSTKTFFTPPSGVWHNEQCGDNAVRMPSRQVAVTCAHARPPPTSVTRTTTSLGASPVLYSSLTSC